MQCRRSVELEMTPACTRLILTLGIAFVSLGTGSGCKDQELETAAELGDPCTPGDEAPCVDGLVCEPLADQQGYLCAGPIELHGMVIDALSNTPIAGARVLALDETSAPISDVAITDAEGHYALPIAIARDSEGNPASALTLTLQASALDYQLYPSGLQPAFPVSTADVIAVDDDPETTADDNLSVIENASTTVALIPLADADRGGFTISGRVASEQAGGTLVVAEGAKAKHTVADVSGEFVLFNIQSGDWSVRGYRGGLQIEPAAVTVADADVADVVLEVGEGGTATVTGSVSIVNAPGGSVTSIVLIPSAVFIPAFEFGPVPYGLRAPEPGLAPNVSGAWTIPGVPAGTYKVIASLENDFLVRDPDLGIAGTQIVEITVDPGTGSFDVPDGFKVTEALEVIGPGRDQPEEVSGTPTFEFADDSSEDRYEVVVHDALGNEIWRDDQIPGVSGNDTVVVPYAGPALTEGMYYRFQATSWRDSGGDSSPISRTEDLRGVFVHRGP